MATFLFDGDELKECPYNSNHRVLSRRLLSHMSKCAAEPNAPKLLVCHYNSLHRLYPHEFNAHIVECPDNRQAIRELFNPVNVVDSQPNNNSEQRTAQSGGWECEGDEVFVLQGLEVGCNDAFIAQHQLYGLKPAERKRIYNQMTENAIRRKAQGEREKLTEAEAAELGLTVERPNFKINTSGRRTSNAEASGSESSQGDRRTNIYRSVGEEEGDNKQEVKKLIRADCFRTRETRD